MLFHLRSPFSAALRNERLRDLARLLLLGLIAAALVLIAACDHDTSPDTQRRQMVAQQLKARDIVDPRVLEVMGKVPRHEFVPADWQDSAYEDRALPIGKGQTISQPYIVALMTQLAAVKPGQRVLEVGTGSGYQAAVLAELGAKVYTIELIEELADEAKARLKRLGHDKIQSKAGDGYLGWPDAAPFDAILVTCGADHVPAPLFDQLKPGGHIVIPVGDSQGQQMLRVISKNKKGEKRERDVVAVRFVPLKRAGEKKAK